VKLDTGNFLADLQRWLKSYKEHIQSIGYSNNTLALYSRVLDEFIEYSRAYQEEMNISDINTLYITSYLSYIENKALKYSNKKLKSKGLSKATKETYIKALKGFFEFISDNNDELYSFSRFFKNIKVINSQKAEEKIEYLKDNEIERLLNMLEREIAKKHNYNFYRNSMLIKLLLYAGLRISEALNIKMGDFEELDEKTFKIKIYAKGGREQFAYIGKKIIKEEFEYFKNIALLKDDDLIMVTKKGKQLTRQNAFVIANRLYNKAGIYKRGLHLLRHTFAMRLTKKGANVLVIKKAMRHSSINSTMVYAKAEESDVVRVIEK
jgi:integrase/recombinase XerD